MKLYYSAGTCSLSPHIVLFEAGLPFESVAVSLRSKKTADGRNYLEINPKGAVPLLELDDGQRLSEGAAIVQYLADLAPASGLAPAAGTLARYRLMEWLSYIGSELHKSFGPLFWPTLGADAKAVFKASLEAKLAWVDGQLAGRTFLLGDTFTAADAYLFTVVGWHHYVGIDLAGLPNLTAYQARIAARPAVQAAMKAEGLLK